MYIWILLATIMIALSFFNLSPRADKEGVFTEVKALSLISRFKIEHTAFSRVVECKLLNSTTSDSATGKFNPKNGVDKYIWENEALPIGYERGTDLSTIVHYHYCLVDDVELGGSPALATNCLNSSGTPVHRYAVTFAKIPDRWLSKDEGDIIPVLNNALSKQYVKGSILGIATCAVNGENTAVQSCTFQGTASYIKNLKDSEDQKTEAEPRKGFLSFDGTSGFYHALFANSDFKNNCGGSCFFAIHKLSNKDVDKHCETLYKDYQKAIDTSTFVPGDDRVIDKSVIGEIVGPIEKYPLFQESGGQAQIDKFIVNEP